MAITYVDSTDAGSALDSLLAPAYLPSATADSASATEATVDDLVGATVDLAVAMDASATSLSLFVATADVGSGVSAPGGWLAVMSSADIGVCGEQFGLSLVARSVDAAVGTDSAGALLWVRAEDIGVGAIVATPTLSLFAATADGGVGTERSGESADLGLLYVVDSNTGALWAYEVPVRVAAVSGLAGVLYVASESGLYAMDAETDLGEPVAWRVKTGSSAFGDEHLKRLVDANLLGRSLGPIHLTTVTARSGAKRADTFVAPFAAASAHRGGRISVGQGLSSVYWGLEIEGRAAVEIDSLSLTFHVLSSRR